MILKWMPPTHLRPGQALLIYIRSASVSDAWQRTYMGESSMLEDDDDDLMDNDDDDIEETHLNSNKGTSSDNSRKRIEDYLEELNLKRQIEDMFFDDDF